MDRTPDLILEVKNEGDYLDNGIGCGDINGDHVNGIVIGASGFGQWIGRAYVYRDNELSGPNPKPDRIFTGEDSGDGFGIGLACSDVNNEGFDDLVVGACGYKAGTKQGRAYQLAGNPPRYRVFWAGANQGRAYIYYGGPRNK